MIKLKENEMKIVKNILKKYVPPLKVYIFGSRVKGNVHEHSDLDIALKGSDKIDLLLLADIKEEFQNSDLPFRVDIIDFYRISPEFQRVILNNSILLKFD